MFNVYKDVSLTDLMISITSGIQQFYNLVLLHKGLFLHSRQLSGNKAVFLENVLITFSNSFYTFLEWFFFNFFYEFVYLINIPTNS